MHTCPYCGRALIQSYKGSCGPNCPGPSSQANDVMLTKDQIQDLINLVALKMAESAISAWTYNKLLKLRETLTRMKG